MTHWQRRAAAALRDDLEMLGTRRMPANKDGFDEEFDKLRLVDHKIRCNRDEFYHGSLGSNLSKNRFRDVLPNENTRVALDPVNERGDGDYINANYVDARRLFAVPFVYIATQAPLKTTIHDFWRMVFENNVVYIVMLCAEIESGKVKSERYWPDAVGETVQLGPLSVTLLSENHRNDTIFRTIHLETIDGKERRIQHFQYIRWPDRGIPQSSAPLMEIMHALAKSPVSTQTPIVVHCSGGVGRTGVFLAIHISLALFQLEQPVSVMRVVQYLKYCRSGMVQRKDQYLFAYYAILREMEHFIWSKETRRQVDERILEAELTAGPPPAERRQSLNRQKHPAQQPPSILKSSLRAPKELASGNSRSGGWGSGSFGNDQQGRYHYENGEQQQQRYHQQASAAARPMSPVSIGNLERPHHSIRYQPDRIMISGGSQLEQDLEAHLRAIQSTNQLMRSSIAPGTGGGSQARHEDDGPRIQPLSGGANNNDNRFASATFGPTFASPSTDPSTNARQQQQPVRMEPIERPAPASTSLGGPSSPAAGNTTSRAPELRLSNTPGRQHPSGVVNTPGQRSTAGNDQTFVSPSAAPSPINASMRETTTGGSSGGGTGHMTAASAASPPPSSRMHQLGTAQSPIVPTHDSRPLPNDGPSASIERSAHQPSVGGAAPRSTGGASTTTGGGDFESQVGDFNAKIFGGGGAGGGGGSARPRRDATLL